jgi:hypothetical protein
MRALPHLCRADAGTHGSGVEILRATNHINQRSFYFADPDGSTLEIYYELPHALELFRGGRDDHDEALQVSGPDEPLPGWLIEDWPAPEMKARIETLHPQNERTRA